MNRMWEIREGYDTRSHRSSLYDEEAYECGYEEGYKKAMEEIERSYKRRY